MIPRGEVGLILAGIGLTLNLPNAQGVAEPVIGKATFAAVVIMVIFTTLVTPPLLKWSLARTALAPDAEADAAVQTYADENVERTRQ
jgi:Kef-type K+ transport system membrane component KefB